MGDPLATGLMTTNLLVDKAFHRIPNSAFKAETYNVLHPKRILSRRTKKKHRSRSRGRAPPESESEEEEEYEVEEVSPSRSPAKNDRYGPDSLSPQYSRAPPRERPQYVPSRGGAPNQYSTSRYGAQDYYPPPPPIPSQEYLPGYDRYGRPTRRIMDDNDAYYNSSAVRRPNGPQRRPSSFNGRDGGVRARARQEEEEAKQAMGKEAEEAEQKGHSLKEDFFSASGAGLTGGVVGAVLGGWAAEKIQEKGGREEVGSANYFLTSLGAIAGGLAVNRAVDKYESKKRGERKQKNREEDVRSESAKHRGSGSSGRRRGSSGGRRQSSGGRRRRLSEGQRGRERDYSVGDYRGGEYRGERDGRGYQPYDDRDD